MQDLAASDRRVSGTCAAAAMPRHVRLQLDIDDGAELFRLGNRDCPIAEFDQTIGLEPPQDRAGCLSGHVRHCSEFVLTGLSIVTPLTIGAAASDAQQHGDTAPLGIAINRSVAIWVTGRRPLSDRRPSSRNQSGLLAITASMPFAKEEQSRRLSG